MNEIIQFSDVKQAIAQAGVLSREIELYWENNPMNDLSFSLTRRLIESMDILSQALVLIKQKPSQYMIQIANPMQLINTLLKYLDVLNSYYKRLNYGKNNLH